MRFGSYGPMRSMSPVAWSRRRGEKTRSECGDSWRQCIPFSSELARRQPIKDGSAPDILTFSFKLKAKLLHDATRAHVVRPRAAHDLVPTQHFKGMTQTCSAGLGREAVVPCEGDKGVRQFDRVQWFIR